MDELPVCKLDVSRLPATGKDWNLVANENEREAIAKFAGFSTVENFGGEFHVAPFGEGGAEIAGHIDADIVQTCVVTLEPVREHIKAPIEIRFLPEKTQRQDARKELVVDAFEDDPPESFDGFIDLWQLAIEALILHANPFPRSVDADEELAATAENNEDTGDGSPFSVLSRFGFDADEQGGNK